MRLQSPASDPFAHCSSHPALTPGPSYAQPVSRTEATVPRLQPEEFASPLQSGLRYGIMSHISAQPGFSPGSSQQVCCMALACQCSCAIAHHRRWIHALHLSRRFRPCLLGTATRAARVLSKGSLAF